MLSPSPFIPPHHRVPPMLASSLLGWRLIALPFIFAVLLLVVPLALMTALSLWSQEYLTLTRTLTLANYQEILSHPVYLRLLARSLLVAAAVAGLTVLVAFPLAYYIVFYGGRFRAMWLFLIIIPFWTSYLLRIFLWKIILGYNGVINSALTSSGIITTPLSFLLYNQGAVIITLAHSWLAFAVMPIYVALSRIDRRLFEAALDLGDDWRGRFMRITLPLAMPGVIAAVLIVFISALGDYVAPRLVGGAEGLLIANIIQTQFTKANNAPLAASLAMTIVLLVVVVASCLWLMRRRHWQQNSGLV
ncbi:MAG: ABC transporter permease [Proteobacteria bacterium]|nr:ABC transporter permease [Pseudomonadota bacterium]